MARTITVTLPDGYENTSHIVLVSADETRIDGKVVSYAVTVLDGEGQEVEEVGCGPLGALLTDAGKIVRNGPTPVTPVDLLPVGTKVVVESGTLRGLVGVIRTGPSSDGYQNVETSNGTVVTVVSRWMKRL